MDEDNSLPLERLRPIHSYPGGSLFFDLTSSLYDRFIKANRDPPDPDPVYAKYKDPTLTVEPRRVLPAIFGTGQSENPVREVLMWKSVVGPPSPPRIVVTNTMRADILERFYRHPRLTGSAEALHSRLREIYANISFRQVHGFIDRVESWQLHRPVLGFNREVYRPIIRDQPFKMWEIDITYIPKSVRIGPNYIRKLRKNKRYLMTCVDVFSKYAWAIPLHFKSAGETKEALDAILQTITENMGVKKTLSRQKGTFHRYHEERHGIPGKIIPDEFRIHRRIPAVIQTDNGKEFEGEFKTLCKFKRIRLIHSLPYKPASQGQVERFNRTIKTMLLRRVLDTGDAEWTKFLPDILLNYNSTVHHTTKVRPIDLMDLDVDSKTPEAIAKRQLHAKALANIVKRAIRMVKKSRVCNAPVIDSNDYVRIALIAIAKSDQLADEDEPRAAARKSGHVKGTERAWTLSVFKVVGKEPGNTYLKELAKESTCQRGDIGCERTTDGCPQTLDQIVDKANVLWPSRWYFVARTTHKEATYADVVRLDIQTKPKSKDSFNLTISQEPINTGDLVMLKSDWDAISVANGQTAEVNNDQIMQSKRYIWTVVHHPRHNALVLERLHPREKRRFWRHELLKITPFELIKLERKESQRRQMASEEIKMSAEVEELKDFESRYGVKGADVFSDGGRFLRSKKAKRPPATDPEEPTPRRSLRIAAKHQASIRKAI